MLLRRPAGDVGVHRRGTATTQMRPRRRNPKGAWVLRAIAALLVVDDAHRHRLPPRALRSPHNTHARDRLYFHHGLLGRPRDPKRRSAKRARRTNGSPMRKYIAAAS